MAPISRVVGTVSIYRTLIWYISSCLVYWHGLVMIYFHCVIVIVLQVLTSNNNYRIIEQSITLIPIVFSLKKDQMFLLPFLLSLKQGQ